MKMTRFASVTALVLFGATLASSQEAARILNPIQCNFIGESEHTCVPLAFGGATRSAKTVALIAFDATPTWADIAQRLDPSTSPHEYDQLRESFFERFVAPQIQTMHMVAAREHFMELTEGKPRAYPGGGVLSRSKGSEESEELRRYAEKLMRQGGRFMVVQHPERADLVLEVRKYSWFGFDSGEDQPVAFILVWPRNANPRTDNVIWLEKFQAKWSRTDVGPAVFESFHKSAKQAEQLATRRTPPNR